MDHRRLQGLRVDDVRPVPAEDIPAVRWPIDDETGTELGPAEVYARYPPAVAGEAISRLQELRDVEPAMTTGLVGALPSGTQLRGLASRIKSPDSLARKIADRRKLKAMPPHRVADELTDLVRYTVACQGPERLVADTEATVQALRQRGWTVTEVQHAYAAGNPYKGLHLLLRNPDGWTCEVQFHSEQSLRVKDANHVDYEIERDISRPWSERAAAHARMVERSQSLPTPDGLADRTMLGGCQVEVKRMPNGYANKGDSATATGEEERQ